MNIWIFYALWVAFGAAALVIAKPADPPPRITIVRSAAEDLIARLRPLAKDPSSYYLNVEYSYGKVQITLKFDYDNAVTAVGPTLQSAVNKLQAPNQRIQEALAGWKADGP